MTRTKSASATIHDVARLAGVSVATVSRYINRTVPVSAEVAERIERVMAEIRYSPLATARSLATHKTNTVGLLLTVISGDFFAPLISGIEAATSVSGYDLLISSNRQRVSRIGASAPLGPHNTDGLLVFADSLDAAGLQHFYSKNFPMVLIHRSPPAYLPIPCVTVENKAASYQIVEHLIEVHHRQKIVYLRGPQGQEDSDWREQGYRRALSIHNLPFDPALVVSGDFDRQIARSSIQALLASGIEFDAVFAGDDEAAVGVLAALHEAGKSIPSEVAVVGFDDQRMSPYLNPPLTTVRAPTEEVGKVAVEQLVRLIRNGQAEPLSLLPTEIVIRQSCGCD